jgi:uncharacterized lipoprotein YajG
MKRILFLLAIIIAGCAAPPAGTTVSPAQQALNTMVTSCKGVNAAMVAADQAVLSGVLKGNDKDNAIKGFTTAQAGCVATLAALQSAAAAASAPASGAAK